MGSQPPTVSVIIPTYRRSEFLAQTLESVFAQTFNDFEVIVVEDGSHDAESVIAPYKDRLHYLWQENTGVGAARNFGVKHAKGRWFAFVDDDDLWKPTKLERQLAAAEASPEIGMFHTDHFLLLDGEIRTPRRNPPRGSVPSGWIVKDLFLNNFIVMSSVMIRREEFQQIGGFSPVTRYAADFELWMRLARTCRIGYVPEQLTVYRDHKQSLQADLNWHVRYAAMMERLVRENPDMSAEIGHAAIRKHLNHIMWRGGYAHFQADLFAPALHFFTSALRWHPMDPKSLVYALACLGGGPGVRCIRAVKNLLQ